MSMTIAGTSNGARQSKDTNVGPPTELSDEPLDEWFVIAGQSLLAPKPGFILDLETGCGERNGDRYASGTVKVPTLVVRRLVHSKHGEPWLNAFMDSCTAPWWIEFKHAADIGRQVLKITK